ncbi:hypothetical protein ALC57_04722 [Trachymyrmex cornetzi]|uniref:Uncharacterized protein n=1 Tax=Trachymyrmex cornetzi TaxID=471704 RepID=A0A195EDL8_9HYME|nr:hypothetical protein ALC57_04722 [Trachymyrmex cornetzi]
MVHSVMMMVSLLLGVMLGMVLAASVRRISVVNHVDAVARWLASPDLDNAALGDTHLLAAALMMTRRQTSRTIPGRLSRHRRISFTVVPIGVTVVAGSSFTKAACNSRASIFARIHNALL